MTYPIHGKIARTESGGVAVAFTTGWTSTFNVDLDEVTAQGANWKSWLAGCAEWDGTIECMFDPSNPQQKALMDNIINATPGAQLADIEFQMEDSGDYFSGNLILTSFPVTANLSGKVTCSFSFKGNGAPSLTIA